MLLRDSLLIFACFFLRASFFLSLIRAKLIWRANKTSVFICAINESRGSSLLNTPLIIDFRRVLIILSTKSTDASNLESKTETFSSLSSAADVEVLKASISNTPILEFL